MISTTCMHFPLSRPRVVSDSHAQTAGPDCATSSGSIGDRARRSVLESTPPSVVKYGEQILLGDSTWREDQESERNTLELTAAPTSTCTCTATEAWPPRTDTDRINKGDSSIAPCFGWRARWWYPWVFLSGAALRAHAATISSLCAPHASTHVRKAVTRAVHETMHSLSRGLRLPS